MESKNSGISACVPRAEDSLVRRGSAESNSSPHTRAGGSMEGGMERGLEAESTSFSRYKRVECAGGNGRIERDELGRKQRRRLTEERERKRGERKDARFRMSGCLSVRLNPGAHQQPRRKEEVGR